MTDRAYIVSRTLEDKIAIAENTDQNALFVTIGALKEILAVMKQEAVKPIKMQRMDSNFSFFVPYFLCGNCRYELEGKDVMFCAHCGRPVKRE